MNHGEFCTCESCEEYAILTRRRLKESLDSDLQLLTVTQLRKLLKAYGIDYDESDTKDDLIALLLDPDSFPSDMTVKKPKDYTALTALLALPFLLTPAGITKSINAFAQNFGYGATNETMAQIAMGFDVALKWTVHPERSRTGPCEICIDNSESGDYDDTYGTSIGAGVYAPHGDLPEFPAHPGCVCEWEIIAIPIQDVLDKYGGKIIILSDLMKLITGTTPPGPIPTGQQYPTDYYELLRNKGLYTAEDVKKFIEKQADLFPERLLRNLTGIFMPYTFSIEDHQEGVTEETELGYYHRIRKDIYLNWRFLATNPDYEDVINHELAHAAFWTLFDEPHAENFDRLWADIWATTRRSEQVIDYGRFTAVEGWATMAEALMSKIWAGSLGDDNLQADTVAMILNVGETKMTPEEYRDRLDSARAKASLPAFTGDYTLGDPEWAAGGAKRNGLWTILADQLEKNGKEEEAQAFRDFKTRGESVVDIPYMTKKNLANRTAQSQPEAGRRVFTIYDEKGNEKISGLRSVKPIKTSKL